MTPSTLNNLIGKPWLSNGRGPHAFDCWGLVAHVYQTELNITLPDLIVDPYSVPAATKAMTKGCEQAIEDACVLEVDIAQISDYDIVMFKQSRLCFHVGIYVSGGLLHVAHADKKGVKFDRLHRAIAGFSQITVYRWRR